MTHSEKCHDPTTYWDRVKSRCISCKVEPGHGVTPNCGFDDYGGRHENPYEECKDNTFNDGSNAYCRPCASCPPGFNVSSPCSTTTDTKCQETGSGTTGVPVTIQTNQGPNLKPNPTTIPTSLYPESASPNTGLLWAVPLVILISIMLVMISACLIHRKRNRGQHTVLGYNRRSSYINAGFSSLSAPLDNNDLEDILSSNILSAPLQTVLDNLDVFEELVILLDPEVNGVKNTKHLASHCSFPSTWITYTYSMKDSKSPLKAVLEALTSRQPDWTVGHLAKLLRHMERNDAVAVLAKLRLSMMEV